MRKPILLLVILTGFPLLAQPIFTSDHFLRIGDAGAYLGLDATGVQPGAAGNGVTWDFSGLSHKPDDDFEFRVDVPAAAPNTDAYPGTEFITMRVEEGDMVYDYYQSRSDRFFVLGSEVSNVGVFRYTDVSFFAGLPLGFGETNSAPIGGSYHFTSNFGPTGTSALDGMASITYDGFGTLILPDGRSFTGVRRITFVREWEEVGTIGGTDVTAHQKQTRYHFMEGDHSAPLFELVFTDQSVTPAGGETTTQNTQSAAYRVSETSNPMATAPRRGPHLTTEGGGFNSEIIVHNPSDTNQTLSLHPVDGDGGLLAPVDLDLAAGATSRQLANEIFPAEAKSFLAQGCEPCTFAVGYRAIVDNASSAQVHQTQHFENEFRFYPGEWQYLFDGQAVINAGDQDAMITASQIDYDGNLLGTATLETALAPGGKHLSIINDQFVNNPNTVIKLESSQPIGVMVLRISNDFRFLYQNNPLPSSVDGAEGRWLAHVTSQTGGFDTDVFVHNRSDESGSVTFQPYDPSGAALETVDVVVPAGSTRRFAKTELFEATTSHLSVTGSTHCITSVGYRAMADRASTAVVHEAAPVGQSFSIFPGEWDLLFDGIALVNTGTEPATITLSQIGDDGQLLNTAELVAGLAPNGKFLGLLEGRVPTNNNTILRVDSTQPMALLSLRLSKDGLFLYNNEILPQ